MLLILNASILLLCMHNKIFSVRAHESSPTTMVTAEPPFFTDTAAALRNVNNLLAKKHFNANDEINSDQFVEDHYNQATTKQSSSSEGIREPRQLFFHPGQGSLQAFAEGSRCLTARGLSGSCVNARNCLPYLRHGRQLLGFLALPQWPQSVLTQRDSCTFYDYYGWPIRGVCCPNELVSGTSGSLASVPISVTPIWPTLVQPPFAVQAERPVQPNPPIRPRPMPPSSPAEEDCSNNEENLNPDEEHITEVDSNNNNNNNENGIAIAPILENDDSDILEAHNTSDFNTDNYNVIYDPISQSGPFRPYPTLYNEYQYNWPLQFLAGVQQQWPPALPTHPPSSSAKWPPPIPTHPPDHHYPTHPAAFPVNPPISGEAETTTLISIHDSTRKTSSTSSHRPSTLRPGRPSYPSYPIYPNYPTFRPITTVTIRPKPKPSTIAPVTAATAATSTTRRPSMATEGTSVHGLPLNCGIRNPVSPDQERIVGGSSASPNEFPWIVVLFRLGKQFCGGSLITRSHVLSAAHCVARMTSWDVATITAHMGDYDIRNGFEVQHVERRIKRLVRHRGFSFNTLHNDVAILTLNEPVKFSYEVQPICLPTSASQMSRSYSGHVGVVAGWGSLRENGPQPSILQKVSIPIWTNTECTRKYGHAAPAGIIASMLCAGQAARDSCSGDSGGPLIVNEGGRYTQVGIVSWGIGCGKGQYPGVYTRVTSLLPWIYKNIKS